MASLKRFRNLHPELKGKQLMNYSIKKILVPVDLSETSFNALDTAVMLAKKHNAQLRLLNILESDSDMSVDDAGFSLITNPVNSSDVLTALAGAIQHSHNIQPEVMQEEGPVS